MQLTRRVLLVGPATAIPLVAQAQDRKKIVVGLLSWWPPAMEAFYVPRLREGLRAYGYVEGRNLELLVTFAGGDADRTRAAARRSVHGGVDVIVARAMAVAASRKQG